MALTQIPPTQTHSILLVAETNLSEDLFQHLLEQDWSLEIVRSNDEALARLRRRPFDLIVTGEATSATQDISLLRSIRLVRPHTRMIILTGRARPRMYCLLFGNMRSAIFLRPTRWSH